MIDTKTIRFSPSAVKSYNSCGRKFKFEKIEKVRVEKENTHHRWLGRLVHVSIYSAVAMLVPDDQQRKNWKIIHKAPEMEKALDVFEKLWHQSFKEGDYVHSLWLAEVGEKPKLKSQKKKVSLRTDDPAVLEVEWKKVAREMVVNGVELLKRIAVISDIEKRLEFQLLDHNWISFLDIRAENPSGKMIYFDFKTSWDKPSPKDVAYDPQFITYSYALKKEYNLDYYPVGYLLHLRSGKYVEFRMTEDNYKYLHGYVKETYQGIEREIFTLASNNWLCPYCDFKDLCDAEKQQKLNRSKYF